MANITSGSVGAITDIDSQSQSTHAVSHQVHEMSFLTLCVQKYFATAPFCKLPGVNIDYHLSLGICWKTYKRQKFLRTNKPFYQQRHTENQSQQNANDYHLMSLQHFLCFYYIYRTSEQVTIMAWVCTG